MMGDNIAWNM